MLEACFEESLSATAASGKKLGYDVYFYEFLKTFRPGKDKKIVLLFDKIENVPSIESFLKLWRKIFHDRFDQPELKKYSLAITGAVDLITLTIGPTSPFNISKKMQLTNLTEEESEQLIDVPFKELGIKIQPKAKKELITQTSGHPQILQHICYILVKKAFEEMRCISIEDIEAAIEKLFNNNEILKILYNQIKANKELEKIIKRVMNGKKVKYNTYPHQAFSLEGAGPIVNNNNYCEIRSKLYKRYLKKKIKTFKGIKFKI